MEALLKENLNYDIDRNIDAEDASPGSQYSSEEDIIQPEEGGGLERVGGHKARDAAAGGDRK